MKKLTIILAIALCSIGAFAQSKPSKKQYIPDCDSSALFSVYPCKVPFHKNGKVVGYTVKKSPFELALSYIRLSNVGTSTISGESFKLLRYIQFGGEWGNWWVDKPDSTGKIRIHIQRKQLKFINDSTAIYTPKK